MVGRSSVRGHGVLQAPDNIIRCAYAVGGGASEKPFRLCVPSQNGFVADPPHRHRTTTSAGLPSLRGGGDSSRPSGVTIRTGPWTTRGPFVLGVMVGISGIPKYTPPPGERNAALRRIILGDNVTEQTAQPAAWEGPSRQGEGPHARTRPAAPPGRCSCVGTGPHAAGYLQAALAWEPRRPSSWRCSRRAACRSTDRSRIAWPSRPRRTSPGRRISR